MNKLTIGLDLDDTITKFIPSIIDNYNKMYNTNHTVDEITSWKIPDTFEHDFWSACTIELLEHIPLKEGAFEIITFPLSSVIVPIESGAPVVGFTSTTDA